MAAGADPLAGAKAALAKANSDFPSSGAKVAGVKPAGEYMHAPYNMAKKPKADSDPAQPIKQMGGDAQQALDNKKKKDEIEAAIKQ